MPLVPLSGRDCSEHRTFVKKAPEVALFEEVLEVPAAPRTALQAVIFEKAVDAQVFHRHSPERDPLRARPEKG